MISNAQTKITYHSRVGPQSVEMFSWLGCRSIVSEALDPLLSRRPLALILMGSSRTSDANLAPPPDAEVLGPATTALCCKASGN